MKQPARKIPALTLALLLALAAPLVPAGGRDVPDQKKSGSDTESSRTAWDPSGLTSCGDQTVATTTVGGLKIEVRVSRDGEISVRPALLRAIGRWYDRLLGGGDGSCSLY